MKNRNGFVSNSSSSSFVLVGMRYSKITDEMKQYFFNKFSDSDGEFDEESFDELAREKDLMISTEYSDAIGFLITQGESETNQLDDKCIPFESLNQKATIFREMFNIPDDVAVNLMTGEMAT